MPEGRTVSRPKVRWIAFDPTGLAHAFADTRGLGGSRSLCQAQTRHEEIHAWPEKSRCSKCLGIVEGSR